MGSQNFINIRTEKVGRHNLINIPIKKTVGTDCTNKSYNIPTVLSANVRGIAKKVDEIQQVQQNLIMSMQYV